MTRSPSALLLGLLSPMDLQEPTCPLPDGIWAEIVSLAIAHRVAPLLYRRFQQASGWNLPKPEVLRLKAAHEASARRSLTLVRNLLRVSAILQREGIAWAALKGAFLSLHAYPEPALRPVRDLDILVEPARAAEAFELLIKAGFERRLDEALPTDQAHRRHLPALVEPETGMIVEVHTRLFESGSDAAGRSYVRRALAEVASQAVAGHEIPYLALHDTALHLIVHAAHDHTFDNGPLIFSDLACLTALRGFDWDAFRTRTRALGFERAASVVLNLTERYHGPLQTGHPVPEQAVPPEILDCAERLVLGDYQLRSTHALRASLATSRGRRLLAVIGRHAIPSRYALRTFAGAERARWPLPLIYCWWAAARAAQLVDSYRSSPRNAQTRAAASLQTWLQAAH